MTRNSEKGMNSMLMVINFFQKIFQIIIEENISNMDIIINLIILELIGKIVL